MHITTDGQHMACSGNNLFFLYTCLLHVVNNYYCSNGHVQITC